MPSPSANPNPLPLPDLLSCFLLPAICSLPNFLLCFLLPVQSTALFPAHSADWPSAPCCAPTTCSAFCSLLNLLLCFLFPVCSWPDLQLC